MFFPFTYRPFAFRAKGTSRRLIPARHISWTEQGARTVVVDARSGRYYGFDELGTRIWGLAQQGLSSDEIAQKLSEEYDAPLDVLTKDVVGFISHLRRSKWLEEA
jgi:hypothetical protein